MTDLTLTEMRKDLFRIVDEMVETGRAVRIRRGDMVLEIATRVVEPGKRPLTPKDRWVRFLNKPERQHINSADFEVLESGPHWEWRVPKDLT